MEYTIIAWIAIVLLLIGGYMILTPEKWYSNEPELIPSWVPYIGHPIAMFWNGGKYLRMLSKKWPQYPIFTLPAVTSRIYVVTSPTLAAEVQRKKTLLFDPIVPDITSRVLGFDKKMVEYTRINATRAQGNWGMLPELHDANTKNMGLGEDLEELTLRVVTQLLVKLGDFLEEIGDGEKRVNLLNWTQSIFAPATAIGFYGPKNPLAVKPELEKSYWIFDHSLGTLLLTPLPQLLARKAYLAREKLVDAFKIYLTEDNQVSASQVVRKRIELLEQHQLSRDSKARSELSFLFAGIANTNIASFWLVLRILASAALTAAVRAELLEAHGLAPGARAVTLRLATIKALPLLGACLRETMRLASDAPSTRLVTEKTVLADKTTGATYSLRKDAVVQIAGAAMHSDARIWGPDVDEFRPERFLAKSEDKDKEGRDHPAAYRAFGGGSTLCPGRYLANWEVLTWTAAAVLALDVVGDVQVPDKIDDILPVHLCEPRGDVNVVFKKSGVVVDFMP